MPIHTVAKGLQVFWYENISAFVASASNEIKVKYYVARTYRKNISLSIIGVAGHNVILNVSKEISYNVIPFENLRFNFSEEYSHLYVNFNFPNNSRHFQLLSVHLAQTSPHFNPYWEDH